MRELFLFAKTWHIPKLISNIAIRKDLLLLLIYCGPHKIVWSKITPLRHCFNAHTSGTHAKSMRIYFTVQAMVLEVLGNGLRFSIKNEAAITLCAKEQACAKDPPKTVAHSLCRRPNLPNPLKPNLSMSMPSSGYNFTGPTSQQLHYFFTRVPLDEYCRQLRLFREHHYPSRHGTLLSNTSSRHMLQPC
jgi:hypothetical protein